MKISMPLCAAVIPVLLCGVGTADTELIVQPDAAAEVDVTIGVSIPIFGGSEASDSTSVLVDQSAMVVDPNPDSEPFTDLEITDHYIYTSSGSLVFEFCWPVIGCAETMFVTVNMLDVRLVGDQTASVDGAGGWAMNGVTYELDLAIDYTGSLLGDGELATTQSAVVDVTGSIGIDGGLLVADNLDIGAIYVEVPSDSLPTGVGYIWIAVDADFSDLIYSGSFNPADLDGDGCVGGSDLTILLGNWGGCCQGDLDGSGEIGGADLTIILAAWGC